MSEIKYDITILTDQRYVDPPRQDAYVRNLLLEDDLVAAALRKAGLRVTRQGWDNPGFDWRTTRLALFRTTWDYFNRFDEFHRWLNRARQQTRLINPPGLIDWNLDKHYLPDLEKAGVRIVPTRMIEAGTPTPLPDLVAATGWREVILKPAVSGAARHTYRISTGEAGRYAGIFSELVAREAFLLQPFIDTVLEHGEVSLMFMGGRYSHAILKRARPGDFRVQDDFGGTVHPWQPSTRQIELAEAAIAACPELPFYGRVDILTGADGRPLVSEVELIEPELWFRFRPEAATELARHLTARAQEAGWLE